MKKNIAISGKLKPEDNRLKGIRSADGPPPKNNTKSIPINIIERAIGTPMKINIKKPENIKIAITFQHSPFHYLPANFLIY